jgi:hypothetical protein
MAECFRFWGETPVDLHTVRFACHTPRRAVQNARELKDCCEIPEMHFDNR